MEVTEGLIFTFAARFMGMRWAGQVNYNTDYEAHDTNYRMALITQARQLVGDNEIIKSLITREIIGMLAPADDIEEYQQAYVQSLEDGSVKQLMTYEDEQIIMTDTGSIPEVGDYGEIDTDDNKQGDQNNATLLGGAGTPITPMGPSYYTQQAVAVQITGLNTGR
jgi:hypothetical protein